MMNSYKLDSDESELSLQKASSYFHPLEDFLLTASLKYNFDIRIHPFVFLVLLQGKQDLSSSPRDCTHAACGGSTES